MISIFYHVIANVGGKTTTATYSKLQDIEASIQGDKMNSNEMSTDELSAEESSDTETFIDRGVSDDDDSSDNKTKFINYQHSVKRLKKQKQKQNSSVVEPELETEKTKEEKLAYLVGLLRKSQNKITLWQSFPGIRSQHGVIMCYEQYFLKFRINLNDVCNNKNYEITLNENEIIFVSQTDKEDTRYDKHGLSRIKVCRSYKLPYPIDYSNAVCDERENILNVCVPWLVPLL